MAPWHLGESFESVDEQYEYWEALLNKIVDDHLPTRDMKVRADNVPYMTREWKNAMKAKRRFSKAQWIPDSQKSWIPFFSRF